MSALVCTALAVTLTACDNDRPRRDTRRTEGRVIDEPFADLYVVAGEDRRKTHLYALDLLNLELDRLSPIRVRRIVGQCRGRPVLVALVSGRRRLMELHGGELRRADLDPSERETCRSSRADRHVPGWISHEVSPSGRRIFLTDGRRVAVATGDQVERIGRTEVPIWSAVWVRR